MRNNKCALSLPRLAIGVKSRDLAAAHALRRDNCSGRALTPAICKGKYQIKG